MKVLQVSYYGTGGAGGAISMRRLHFGLRDAGICCKVISAKGSSPSSDITVLPLSKNLRHLQSFLERLTTKAGLRDIFDLRSLTIRRHKVYLDADIVHLHRILDFISYLALPKLTELKPSVLTLHDMWAFTGHCYHGLDCERWKTGCGACPHPDTPPPIERDSTMLEWKLKKWAYSRSDLTIVSPSMWMTKQVNESMLSHFPVCHIPHGVDTQIYRPLDREKCRAVLGVQPDKKVLLFLAASAQHKIKGGDLLVEALKRLPESLKSEILLLLIGNNGEYITNAVDVQTLDLGYVSSDTLKAIAYSTADVFIHPTRADNFPLVLLESLACGTPIVSFKVGGVPDTVRPGATGYLAEPENVEDLINGIVQLLGDDSGRIRMSQQCREIALKEYSLKLWVERHIELYKNLLKR